MSDSDAKQNLLNDTNMEEKWHLCCSHTDSRALKFIIQCAMGSSIMIFSMIQIANAETGAHTEIYWSLLSSTLGYFLPHPTPS